MKTLLLLLALCTCGLALVLNAQPVNGFPVLTETALGMLEGSYDTKTGVQSYLGIPFAQPPVGDLRWRAPGSYGSSGRGRGCAGLSPLWRSTLY